MSTCLRTPAPEFAALVALDWGDRKHCWALRPVPEGAVESGELENTPEAIALWAAQLEQRFGGRPIAVALEQQQGAVVYMLSRHAHLVLFAVPSSMSAAYRKAFCPAGAKNDPGDTALLLDLLLCHRQRLRCYQPDTTDTRLLQMLVEERRQSVEQKTGVVQRLTDCLKQYFPQLLRWFGSPDRLLVADLLDQWPTLQQLQSTNPAPLARFFRQHHFGNEERIHQQIQDMYTAVAATTDAAVLEARTLRARALVRLLRTLWLTIAELEARIQQLVAQHPDAALFASLPGAGAATVPRLIAAFGTQRDRFDTAYQLQCFSGIAPVLKASGKTRTVQFRLACPKFLRQTFHEFAGQSVRYCAWAKAFYEYQRTRGVPHHTAIRALAYKWIRIIFRCWKDRQPYDEARYLASLRRRGALLGAVFARPPEIKWKSVAGFQKLSEI
ncbi:MAG TPA: transposase [Terriglobales bacterium]|nr:transposase [Terriglobales bacterium]